MKKDTISTTAPKFSKPVLRIDGHTHLRKQDGCNVFTPEKRIAFNEMVGIDHCIILTVEKPTEMMTEQERLADPRIYAEDAALICKNYKKHFSWFCNVIPDGTSATYKAIENYKEMGAIGVGEIAIPMYFDDPRFQHLLDCCQSLDLPILIHNNPTLTHKGIVDKAGLLDLEAALKKYPRLKYIGHSAPFWAEVNQLADDADRNLYLPGPVKAGRLVDLLADYENLYGDLSANSGGNAILRDADFGIEFLEKFQDKLMYGTDTLNYDLHYPLGAYLDSLLGQKKLSVEAYTKVCRSNIVNLLKLDV